MAIGAARRRGVVMLSPDASRIDLQVGSDDGREIRHTRSSHQRATSLRVGFVIVILLLGLAVTIRREYQPVASKLVTLRSENSSSMIPRSKDTGPPLTSKPVDLPRTSIEFPGVVSRRGLAQARCRGVIASGALLNVAVAGVGFIEGHSDGHLAVAITSIREAALRRRLRRQTAPGSLEAQFGNVGGRTDVGLKPKGRVLLEESPLDAVLLGVPRGDNGGRHPTTVMRWLINILSTIPSSLTWYGAGDSDLPLGDLVSEGSDDEVVFVSATSPLPFIRAVLARLRHCSTKQATTEPWYLDSNADRLHSLLPALIHTNFVRAIPLLDPRASRPSHGPDIVLIPSVHGARDTAWKLQVAFELGAEFIFISGLSNDPNDQSIPLDDPHLSWAADTVQNPVEKSKLDSLLEVTSTSRVVSRFLTRYGKDYHLLRNFFQPPNKENRKSGLRNGGCALLSRRAASSDEVPDVGRLRRLWHSIRPPLVSNAAGSVDFSEMIARRGLKRVAREPPVQADPAKAAEPAEVFEVRRAYYESQSVEGTFSSTLLCEATIARYFSNTGSMSGIADPTEWCRDSAEIKWAGPFGKSVVAPVLVDIVAGGTTLPSTTLYDLIDQMDPSPSFKTVFSLVQDVTNKQSRSPRGISTFAADALPLLLESAGSARSLLVVGCSYVLLAIALHVHLSTGAAIGVYGYDTCETEFLSTYGYLFEGRLDDPGITHELYNSKSRTPRYGVALVSYGTLLAPSFGTVMSQVETIAPHHEGATQLRVNFAADKIVVFDLLANLSNSGAEAADASLTRVWIADYETHVSDADAGSNQTAFPVLVAGGGMVEFRRSRLAPPVLDIFAAAALANQMKMSHPPIRPPV